MPIHLIRRVEPTFPVLTVPEDGIPKKEELTRVFGRTWVIKEDSYGRACFVEARPINMDDNPVPVRLKPNTMAGFNVDGRFVEYFLGDMELPVEVVQENVTETEQSAAYAVRQKGIPAEFMSSDELWQEMVNTKK